MFSFAVIYTGSLSMNNDTIYIPKYDITIVNKAEMLRNCRPRLLATGKCSILCYINDVGGRLLIKAY